MRGETVVNPPRGGLALPTLRQSFLRNGARAGSIRREGATRWPLTQRNVRAGQTLHRGGGHLASDGWHCQRPQQGRAGLGVLPPGQIKYSTGFVWSQGKFQVSGFEFEGTTDFADSD